MDRMSLGPNAPQFEPEELVGALHDQPAGEPQRAMPKKLLPFPWIFATRKRARRIIERNESLRRIIDAQGREADRLRKIAGEDVRPRRPACPECGRPGSAV
jgi:hypothetical protein